MLELYTSEPNTFFLKPLIALAEKQAAFTTRYFDAANLDQFAAGFPTDLEAGLQLEREGPLLLHDGTLISSSFFMLEYISEGLPGRSLMPAEPFDAYRARAWGQFLGANLGSGVTVLGAAKYLRPHLATLDPDWVERRIAAIEPIERRAGWLALRNGTYTEAYLQTVRDRLAAPIMRVEKALKQGPWLAGSEFSVADIDAYPMLCVLPDLASALVNPAASPRIMEYLGRIAARDSVRAARSTARTKNPEQQFVPGVEASRWG
ncbi:MAG TPA: glutathione binding-like protein [Steroidobacteraceae bacterium]|nr:glutathione binding-like protein [Steroidobacteraceae bacterium]